jgi:hypothetical protein
LALDCFAALGRVDEGDARAQFILGVMYADPLGHLGRVKSENSDAMRTLLRDNDPPPKMTHGIMTPRLR